MRTVTDDCSDDADEPLCVVCWEAPKTHVFTSCMHKCVCPGCAHDVMKAGTASCPLCRKPSLEVRFVYE